MRAVTMRHGHLELKDIPEPPMTDDHLLVEPLSAGVRGGDLNAMDHADDFLHVSRPVARPLFLFDPDRDLVFGHEFTARVREVGANVEGRRRRRAARVTGRVTRRLVHCVGYATDYPGALAEQVVVSPYGHVKIPDGVSPYDAATVDPVATGLNGVWRSKIDPPAGAIVTGAARGSGLGRRPAERGISPIVASDPSAARRRIAAAFGAHVVVDPPRITRSRRGAILPSPTSASSCTRPRVSPGILDSLLYTVPSYTRITVVGACMVDDPIRPIVGINKNVTIEFCVGRVRRRGVPVRGDVRAHRRRPHRRHRARHRLRRARRRRGGVRHLRPGTTANIEHAETSCATTSTGRNPSAFLTVTVQRCARPPGRTDAGAAVRGRCRGTYRS